MAKISPTFPSLKNASKQDEIDFITAIADGLDKDSYLSGLFGERLVSWVTTHIKNDFPCDIFDLEIDARQKDLNDKVEEHILDGHEILRLGNEIKTLKERIEAASQYAAGQIEFLNKAIIHRDEQITYLTERNVELATGFNDATAKIAERDQRILELKARIYDLEHGDK